MASESYLIHLTTRLAEGIARLPEEVRTRHLRYLQKCQNADGGFSGREGGSDLYYTGFALRSLAILDGLTPEVCERAAGFLHQRLAGQASVIDFFSFLYSCALVQLGGVDVLAESPPDWPERVASTLESFRTKDGGYGKAIGAASGSTYHTFLVALCYQLLDRPLPRSETVIPFLASRRREDGGYVEIAPMKRSGTNPTAAAIGVLQILEIQQPGLLAEVREEVATFLAQMCSSTEGGMTANARAPLADLLSTFTASWTLEQLGERQRLEEESVVCYAENLQRAEGGFHGTLYDKLENPDKGHDVEYTFYGLGVLGLFA